jgi:hypothetical protein
MEQNTRVFCQIDVQEFYLWSNFPGTFSLLIYGLACAVVPVEQMLGQLWARDEDALHAVCQVRLNSVFRSVFDDLCPAIGAILYTQLDHQILFGLQVRTAVHTVGYIVSPLDEIHQKKDAK